MSASLPFQIFLKNRTLVPPETFGNIFAFDKESKRKLLSLISADSFIKNKLYVYGLKFLLCLNGTFLLKKTSFRYYGF